MQPEPIQQQGRLRGLRGAECCLSRFSDESDDASVRAIPDTLHTGRQSRLPSVFDTVFDIAGPRGHDAPASVCSRIHNASS